MRPDVDGICADLGFAFAYADDEPSSDETVRYEFALEEVDAGPAVLQAFHPLPGFEGLRPVVESWIVGDRPCGIGIREDATAITGNRSRFVPHAIT